MPAKVFLNQGSSGVDNKPAWNETTVTANTGGASILANQQSSDTLVGGQEIGM